MTTKSPIRAGLISIDRCKRPEQTKPRRDLDKIQIKAIFHICACDSWLIIIILRNNCLGVDKERAKQKQTKQFHSL